MIQPYAKYSNYHNITERLSYQRMPSRNKTFVDYWLWLLRFLKKLDHYSKKKLKKNLPKGTNKIWSVVSVVIPSHMNNTWI